MYETLEVLKHLPAEIVTEQFLIPQVRNCNTHKKFFSFRMIVLQVLRLDVTEEDMEREHRSGTNNKGRKLHFSPPGCKNLVKQPFPTQEATFPPFPTQEATEAKESSTGPTGGD